MYPHVKIVLILLYSVPYMCNSSFIPETYALDTLLLSRSKDSAFVRPIIIHAQCLQFVKYIRQQYDRINQSILKSKICSAFVSGTSPHTNLRTARQVSIANL